MGRHPALPALPCPMFQSPPAPPLPTPQSSTPLSLHSCFTLSRPELRRVHPLRALLHQSEAHLQSSQPFPHPLRVYPGWYPERFLAVDLQLSTVDFLSPLESALTDELRVSPGFGRNPRRITPLESALTDTLPITPFRINTYRKQGGAGHYVN